MRARTPLRLVSAVSARGCAVRCGRLTLDTRSTCGAACVSSRVRRVELVRAPPSAVRPCAAPCSLRPTAPPARTGTGLCYTGRVVGVGPARAAAD